MTAASLFNRADDCMRVWRLLTIGLVVLLLGNVLVVNGLLWLLTPSGLGGTVLDQTWGFFEGDTDGDSWGPMAQALRYFLHQHRTGLSPVPIYSEIVLNRHVKFQYPPSSLLVLLWLGFREQATLLRDLMMWGFVILAAVSTAILLEWRLRQAIAVQARDRTLVWLRAAVAVGLALTFYPLVKAYTLGQIQAWINGLFALAVLCWALGHKASAGVLVGVMALIKPHYALLVPWALLRREWRFLLPFLATAGAGGCLSLIVFGWENHLDYLQVLSRIASRGESYHPNHSVNGLLNRLVGLADPANYNNLDWRKDRFPPRHALASAVTLASSVLLLGLALLRRRREDDRDGLIDLCTIAVSCTMASPIAWEHHYGILLPVFAVLLARQVHDTRQLIWLGVAYVLASNFIPATKLLAATPLNVAQSYLLAAAVIVLVLLYRGAAPFSPGQQADSPWRRSWRRFPWRQWDAIGSKRSG
jgi:hypothetical protein